MNFFQPQYDISAVSRYGVIGSGFMAPVLYGWYRALDSYYPGRRWRIVVKKLILDSTILSIPLYSIFFLGEYLGYRKLIAKYCRCKSFCRYKPTGRPERHLCRVEAKVLGHLRDRNVVLGSPSGCELCLRPPTTQGHLHCWVHIPGNQRSLPDQEDEMNETPQFTKIFY